MLELLGDLGIIREVELAPRLHVRHGYKLPPKTPSSCGWKLLAPEILDKVHARHHVFPLQEWLQLLRQQLHIHHGGIMSEDKQRLDQRHLWLRGCPTL